MSTATPRQVAADYLKQLNQTLSEIYDDGLRFAVPTDVRPNGVVAGVFLTDAGERFQFLISADEVRYKLAPDQKLDAYATGFLASRTDLPPSLLQGDAYSSGFLSVWNRMDAKKRSPARCKTGIACNRTCISRKDECRVAVSSPVTQRKIKSLVDAGKVVSRLGGNSILLPILGAGAIGVVGFAAGLSVGSYVGAASAAKPQKAKPAAATPAAEPKTRRKKFVAEDIPDPWSDEPTPAAATSDKPKPQRKPIEPVPPPPTGSSKPKPKKKPQGEDIEQLPIDQGVRYVTQEVEKRVVVAPDNEDGTYRMSPDDIRLSPKLFQYKLPNEVSARAAQEFREQGTTGSLGDVTVWNPQVAGSVKAWRVPKDFKANGESFSEGEVLLVHGHHRLALAKRATAVASEDPTQPPTPGKVEEIKVEFIQADDWKQARIVGAMENIAAGAGTSRDAANLFRELKVTDATQLKGQGLSLKNRIAEEGMGLAGLNDRLWRKVTDPSNTELSLRKASYIGTIRNPDLQEEVWKQVKETSNPTDEYVKSLSRTVQHQLETGQVEMRSSGDEGQGMLFNVEETVANLKDRAEIDAYIESQIASEAAFWNKAAKPQKLRDILSAEGAGDINVERSSELSEQTNVARYLYQRGKFLQADENYATITNALIQAGNQLRAMRDREASKTEIDEFKRASYTSIRDLLAAAMGD